MTTAAVEEYKVILSVGDTTLSDNIVIDGLRTMRSWEKFCTFARDSS
ncbi:MAG: hypothetical protein N5P05_004622 (plasmid) [Chroococcopsis gigantea SAG 12.99]|nr:hypothetical protein [Chroococcopsis gigantea SAG 12.99]